MPDDYPLPRFDFSVDWGGVKIELHRGHRPGDGAREDRVPAQRQQGALNKIAMPGLVKNNNFTLKRGTFDGDSASTTFLEEVAAERVENRRDVTISAAQREARPGGRLDGRPVLRRSS